MSRIPVSPATYHVENLTAYSAVTVRGNGGRLTTVNKPSIAYYPVGGGITVRSRMDATVKSTHSSAAIVTYYRDGVAVTHGDTIPSGIRECVRRAVIVLDEKVPGWASRVDSDELNMMSPTRCILGQVFRDEAQAFNAAHRDRNISGYGWANNVDGFATIHGEAFANYDDEWRVVLNARR
jgi:hypothetical protein